MARQEAVPGARPTGIIMAVSTPPLRCHKPREYEDDLTNLHPNKFPVQRVPTIFHRPGGTVLALHTMA